MAGRTLQEDNHRFNGTDPVADSGLALDQCELSLFNETVLPKFPSLIALSCELPRFVLYSRDDRSGRFMLGLNSGLL